MSWTDYKVAIPERSLGDWSIERFEVPNRSIAALFYGHRAPVPGTYTKLSYKREIVMSDTPAEIRDLYQIRTHCREGMEVLVLGLGLGVAIKMLILNGASKITVIENSKEVLELSGKYWDMIYPGKLELIHADAFSYSPPKDRKWDIGWADIWNNICSDNAKDFTKLRRKYARFLRTDHRPKLMCWAEYECRRRR